MAPPRAHRDHGLPQKEWEVSLRVDVVDLGSPTLCSMWTWDAMQCRREEVREWVEALWPVTRIAGWTSLVIANGYVCMSVCIYESGYPNLKPYALEWNCGSAKDINCIGMLGLLDLWKTEFCFLMRLAMPSTTADYASMVVKDIAVFYKVNPSHVQDVLHLFGECWVDESTWERRRQQRRALCGSMSLIVRASLCKRWAIFDSLHRSMALQETSLRDNQLLNTLISAVTRPCHLLPFHIFSVKGIDFFL